jgi:hypothetical protein
MDRWFISPYDFLKQIIDLRSPAEPTKEPKLMSLKKLALSALLIFAVSPAFAEGWGFLPVLDSSYRLDPIVSFKGGVMAPDLKGVDNVTMFGAEANINCPLLRAPVPVRQQISVNYGKKEDAQITTFEANPHFMFPIAEGLSLGAGPGFGLVMLDTVGTEFDKNLWALQAGVSLQYVWGPLSLGAKARYQYTEQIGIGDKQGLNNTFVSGKVGYRFF